MADIGKGEQDVGYPSSSSTNRNDLVENDAGDEHGLIDSLSSSIGKFSNDLLVAEYWPMRDVLMSSSVIEKAGQLAQELNVWLEFLSVAEMEDGRVQGSVCLRRGENFRLGEMRKKLVKHLGDQLGQVDDNAKLRFCFLTCAGAGNTHILELVLMDIANEGWYFRLVDQELSHDNSILWKYVVRKTRPPLYERPADYVCDASNFAHIEYQMGCFIRAGIEMQSISGTIPFDERMVIETCAAKKGCFVDSGGFLTRALSACVPIGQDQKKPFSASVTVSWDRLSSFLTKFLCVTHDRDTVFQQFGQELYLASVKYRHLTSATVEPGDGEQDGQFKDIGACVRVVFTNDLQSADLGSAIDEHGDDGSEEGEWIQIVKDNALFLEQCFVDRALALVDSLEEDPNQVSAVLSVPCILAQSIARIPRIRAAITSKRLKPIMPEGSHGIWFERSESSLRTQQLDRITEFLDSTASFLNVSFLRNHTALKKDINKLASYGRIRVAERKRRMIGKRGRYDDYDEEGGGGGGVYTDDVLSLQSAHYVLVRPGDPFPDSTEEVGHRSDGRQAVDDKEGEEEEEEEMSSIVEEHRMSARLYDSICPNQKYLPLGFTVVMRKKRNGVSVEPFFFDHITRRATQTFPDGVMTSGAGIQQQKPLTDSERLYDKFCGPEQRSTVRAGLTLNHDGDASLVVVDHVTQRAMKFVDEYIHQRKEIAEMGLLQVVKDVHRNFGERTARF